MGGQNVEVIDANVVLRYLVDRTVVRRVTSVLLRQKASLASTLA